MSKESGISRRGFASLTPERRKEIASMGGKSVDPANRAFAKDKNLARAAGRQGGRASKRSPEATE
jgi:general stress protein YciG